MQYYFRAGGLCLSSPGIFSQTFSGVIHAPLSDLCTNKFSGQGNVFGPLCNTRKDIVMAILKTETTGVIRDFNLLTKGL